MPFWSAISGLALIGFVVILILFADLSESLVLVLVGLVVTTIPSMIGALFSERASRDIRNGVIVEKSKDGATEALHETGLSSLVDPEAINSIATMLKEHERKNNG